MTIGGGETVLFWVLGPIAVFGALVLLLARKAVHAAIGMALTMVILGILYITQEAEFLGVIQVFVYSGAVMMLFLFVVMLMGIESSQSLVETLRGQRVYALIAALGLAILLIAAFGNASYTISGLEKVNEQGHISTLAGVLFGRFVWVFEITAALLITAAMAAMVLAHRERIFPKAGQAEQVRQRIASGKQVAGLPSPGVFARSNAVDTPALLPDGSPAPTSVSRVLRTRAQVKAVEESTEPTRQRLEEMKVDES